jgi:hypothetical protein
MVAHSKLQALLAQFEKGKELPAASASTASTAEAVGRQFVSEPKLSTSSPANFSALVGTAGVEHSDNNLSVKSNMAR